MKSHHHSTVMEVLALERVALSNLKLKVYGGVALNGAVGGLNPRAVDNLRDQLFFKLDVKSRVGLAMLAIRNGIVIL